MGINLQILGMQSIPRLADKLGVNVEFPARALTASLRGVEDFQKLLGECEKILCSLLKSKISWWDVYSYSDIGLERMALAQEMVLDKNDTLLDVGCGRGYFSIAAAKLSKQVVSLDLMDGYGRSRWWSNFKESIHELNLAERVAGVKSDGRKLPFKPGSFALATSVHAIRNFQNYDSIEAAIKEMKRVVVKGGNVIVVESLPIARSKAQEAHMKMFRCKVKYTWGELDYPPKAKIVEMFQKAKFRQLEVKEFNYNWSAAPPIFCIEPYLPSLSSSERMKAKTAFEEASTQVEKWGEVSPPALFVRGTV